MSGYRQLHTHIWSDGWFEELEPDLKLLFIYLFSNERASICGLYELPIRTIAFETGLERKLIKRALAAFAKADKASYDFDTSVVWVKNMLKYQGSASPKVQARIQADIKAVPDCPLKQQFLDTLSQAGDTVSIPAEPASVPTDTLSIPYRSSSDTSIYSSSIDQLKQEPPQTQNSGAGAHPAPLPVTPAQAMLHPDLRIFAAVTGGRIPGTSQYQTVIEAVRFLRLREKLDDAALQEYLVSYWLAWSGRKRLDGRPYDPANLTWLTEWALNGSIPPPAGQNGGGPARPSAGSYRPAAPTPEQTRRMLDERDALIKQAVPMPEELRRKMRGLKDKLAVKDAR